MSEDPIEAARKRYLEALPTAALYTLKMYVGHKLPLPDLLIAALKKLPERGRIRLKKDNLSLAAVSHLIDQVPDDDPRKGEISILFQKALTRSSQRKGPS